MKNKTNKGLALKLKPVIAIALIFTGLICTMVDIVSYFIEYPEEIDDILSELDMIAIVRVVSDIMLFAGGVLVFAIKKAETRVVIGATGIVIAVADFTSSCTTLSLFNPMDNPTNVILLLIFAVIPMTDVFLLLFSIRYLQGHKRNAMRMAVALALPLLIFVIEILSAIGLAGSGDLFTFWLTILGYLARTVLYALLLWFVMLPGVREDLSEWKVYKLSKQVYRTTNTDPKASVYRGDLVELVQKMKDRDSWGKSETIPGAREFSIVFGKDMYLKRMTFRIVEGSDVIRTSIVNDDSKEYIQATRFDLREITPVDGDYNDCKSVRIFGNDGFFINIAVRDDMPVPKKTYAVDRFIDWVKFKSAREK